MSTSRSTSVSLLIAAFLWCPASAGFAQAPAKAFDSSKAWEHLRQQVAIGPRPSGSPANVKNRDYIKAQMAALGIKTTEQPFDGATPNGPVKMVNIIATIPGQRSDRIVLASHFDTKLFRELRFVGASDGASSTAALIELGRAIKDKLAALGKTMELHVYDAQHAFCNEKRPEVYNADACQQAWGRTVAFIRSHTK